MENNMVSNQPGCEAVDNAYAAGSPEKPHSDLIAYLKNTDRTWLLIGLIFLAIAIGLPSHLLTSVQFTLDNLWSIAPFLLLSASLAGYLEAASADRMIGKVFSERVVLAIVSAAVFGALSPFCSCGVIPLIAALLVAGVPLAAVMAFWVASPIMSPSMFVVTAAGLGVEFAVVKTFSAIAIGLSAGALTLLLQPMGVFRTPLRSSLVSSCGGGNPGSTQKIKNLPIWVFHGDADDVVPVDRSRSMVEALKKHGSNVKYTEYPGVNHNAWSKTYNNEEVYDWLFKQKK